MSAPDPDDGVYVSRQEEDLAAIFGDIESAQQELESLMADSPTYDDAEKRLATAETHLETLTGSQGERLQEGAAFMAMSDPPEPNYLSYSHEMLQRMVQERNDPGLVGAMGSSWLALGNAFVEFGDTLSKVAACSTSEWRGAAADSAREFTGSLGTWFSHLAQGAQLAGNRLTAQAQLAADVRNSMPEPVAFDLAGALRSAHQQTDLMARHEATAGLRETFVAKQEAHRAAAELAEKYDKLLVEYAATMPAFAAPPTMPGTDASTGDTSPDVPHHHTSPNRDVLNQPTRDRGIPGPASADPGRNPVPVLQTPVTHPSAVVPLPDNGVPQSGRLSQQNLQPQPANQPSRGTPPVGGGYASHERFAGDPGSPRGSIGAMPFALAEGPSAGRAGAGRASAIGARGPGGMGVPAVARRRDEEDYEHERPDYLVEPDPNAIFGTDERTVKPVIGD